jgi:hypothetical protein
MNLIELTARFVLVATLSLADVVFSQATQAKQTPGELERDRLDGLSDFMTISTSHREGKFVNWL